MKKFAANYLISESGTFLKNGVIIVDEEGLAFEYIDTKGDLRETEQLIFYNGILMAGCLYMRTNTLIPFPASNESLRSVVFNSVINSSQFSIQKLIELGKQVQIQFQGMKIPSILNEISNILLTDGGFIKENKSGIYLLTGVDLIDLRFTPNSRLKKIL